MIKEIRNTLIEMSFDIRSVLKEIKTNLLKM